ncbi:MAG: CHAT domain-containing protein [Flavobacteriaceae bacterium]
MKSTVIPPSSFNHKVINFIKRCPSDLVELNKERSHFLINEALLMNNPIDITVVRKDYLDEYLSIFTVDKRISLFFIDNKMKDYIEIFKKINHLDETKCFYYNFFGNENLTGIKNPRIVNSPIEFVQNILDDQNHYKKTINTLIDIAPSFSLDYKHFVREYYFVPTHNNAFMLNRILGNLPSIEKMEEKELKEKIITEGKNAMQSQTSFKRQQKFIIQIEDRDYFTDKMYDDGILKPILTNEIKYSPLVITLPYHNPDLKDFLDSKKAKLLQSEQTQNYINLFEVKSKEIEELTEYHIIMDILRLRLSFLDDIAYLHASFRYSPVIRTPVIGRSINRELSFFKVNNFNNLSAPRNRKNIKKSIEKFGAKITEKLISKNLQKTIINRNSQIVAITDLPVEWFNFNGVPFSFTHDITKIPETFLPGIISIFSQNNNFTYSIPKNIISKTLVIMGSDDNNFTKWLDTIIRFSDNLGFKYEVCLKNEEVLLAIKKHSPEFLIFDCHGGYDSTKKSSYLYIGNEILDGDFIVKNKISAELIFLSACGTSPTYGTINSIANAFFEMGAFSVTTTYLPIEVDSGSRLYLRLLQNLVETSNNPIHKNWLSFISHIIRTSSIMEAYIPFIQNSTARKKDLAKVLSDSMIFNNRVKLFKTITTKLMRFEKKQRESYLNIIPEYLFYSNLGRGDLVLFESWKTVYKEVNDFSNTDSIE